MSVDALLALGLGSFAAGAAATLARALLVDEFKGWFTDRGKRGLDRAIERLSEEDRDAFADDWRATYELAKHRPLKAAKVVRGFNRAARTMSEAGGSLPRLVSRSDADADGTATIDETPPPGRPELEVRWAQQDPGIDVFITYRDPSTGESRLLAAQSKSPTD